MFDRKRNKLRKSCRKMIALLLVASMLLLAGCGTSGNSTGNRKGSGSGGVNDVLQKGKEEADRKNSDATPTPKPTAPLDEQGPTDAPENRGDSSVDVDLTVMTATMVYAEVYNMLVSPESYIGKKVKMQGAFNVYIDTETDAHYYLCVIKDATACCAQGLEFVLAGSHSYPGDYPELGTEITVIGEFDTYVEGDTMYCTLRNATMS
ncbi:MAG: hypothetical protein IK055_09100 [Lachnospiraceae bacterium]|nr:hypothetical protein [Lachnospiraceae bacterium]